MKLLTITTTIATLVVALPAVASAEESDPFNHCSPTGWAASYEPDAPCVEFDPCSDDGTTTLWLMGPCGQDIGGRTDGENGAHGTDATPAKLPTTGATSLLAFMALVFSVTGGALTVAGRRPDHP